MLWVVILELALHVAHVNWSDVLADFKLMHS